MKNNSLKIKGYLLTNGICSSGFTLIELIAVIVILSILSTIGTGFVVKTTEAYQRTQTRALLVNTARQALERMTRQLRIALPYSVKTVNSDYCIKFLPIVASGNYYNPVPDDTNEAPTTNAIKASRSEEVNDFGTPRYVTIGAMSDDEIYGSSPESRATYVDYDNNNLIFSPAMGWLRNSINKRYYLLDSPQAFCIVGNELRFYDGISVADTNVNLLSAHSIIARNVSVVNPLSSKPFSLEAGSENRNTQVKIELIFSSDGESITFEQGVFIRNVP